MRAFGGILSGTWPEWSALVRSLIDDALAALDDASLPGGRAQVEAAFEAVLAELPALDAASLTHGDLYRFADFGKLNELLFEWWPAERCQRPLIDRIVLRVRPEEPQIVGSIDAARRSARSSQRRSARRDARLGWLQRPDESAAARRPALAAVPDPTIRAAPRRPIRANAARTRCKWAQQG